MDSLIQITKSIINNTELNSVNAREIYDYLGLAKGQFSRWIKTAIEKYDFIQNEDFLSIDTDVEGVKDYIVTLDMAKELCMVSNTEKGKEARKYFIEFEKQGKTLINQQSQEIQLLQGMLNTISKMDNRVTELEQTRRLENWQELALIEAKNKKVYSIAEKHDLSNDKEMIRKLHSRVWKCLKKRFNVPRYNEIPAIYFNQAKTTISNLSFKDLL